MFLLEKDFSVVLSNKESEALQEILNLTLNESDCQGTLHNLIETIVFGKVTSTKVVQFAVLREYQKDAEGTWNFFSSSLSAMPSSRCSASVSSLPGKSRA